MTNRSCIDSKASFYYRLLYSVLIWLGACDKTIISYLVSFSMVTIVLCRQVLSCKDYVSLLIGIYTNLAYRRGPLAAIGTTGNHVTYRLTPS